MELLEVGVEVSESTDAFLSAARPFRVHLQVRVVDIITGEPVRVYGSHIFSVVSVPPRTLAVPFTISAINLPPSVAEAERPVLHTAYQLLEYYFRKRAEEVLRGGI